MKLMSLFILFLGLNAFGFGNKLTNVKFKALPTKSDALADCLDFSGTWKGKCKSIDGEEYDFTHVAKQTGCKLLNWGGTEYVLGALYNKQSSDTTGSQANTRSFSFSSNGKIIGLNQSSHTTLFGKKDVHVTHYSVGKVEMSNGKILTVIAGTETEYNDGFVSEEKFKDECVFEVSK